MSLLTKISEMSLHTPKAVHSAEDTPYSPLRTEAEALLSLQSWTQPVPVSHSPGQPLLWHAVVHGFMSYVMLKGKKAIRAARVQV